MHNHFKFAVGAFGFFLCSLNAIVGGKNRRKNGKIIAHELSLL